MKIVSRFRCNAVRAGAYVTLEPIGPPDGQTGIIVGTGRGPCELGKVSDPSDFVADGVYEIEIRRVDDGTPSG